MQLWKCYYARRLLLFVIGGYWYISRFISLFHFTNGARRTPWFDCFERIWLTEIIKAVFFVFCQPFVLRDGFSKESMQIHSANREQCLGEFSLWCPCHLRQNKRNRDSQTTILHYLWYLSPQCEYKLSVLIICLVDHQRATPLNINSGT